MKKENFNNDLFDFLTRSTCAFTCINTIKEQLIKMDMNNSTKMKNGKYFVIRNDASIIAFNIGKDHQNSFNIICTHGDTTGFNLKQKMKYTNITI